MSVSVGIDIQSVSEVEASMAKFGRRYVERVFSRDEADFAFANPHKAAQFLAGRFAAREAVLKVLQLDDAMQYWRDITVSLPDDAPMKVILTDESRNRAEGIGRSLVLVTVSIAGGLAIGVAISEAKHDDME